SPPSKQLEILGELIVLAQARNAGEETLELWVRLGKLKGDKLGDPKGALEAFEKASKQRAGHEGALEGLEKISKNPGPVQKDAMKSLDAALLAAQDHPRRIQVLEARALAAGTSAERATLLKKVAEIY